MNSRTRHVILITSLLLNIFFISWAASHWLKYRIAYTSLLNGVIYTIPVEARPLFRNNLQTNRRELIQALQQLHDGRGKVRDTLIQPELDRKNLDKALTQVRDNLATAVSLLQESMTKTMQDLPPDVRQQWAQQWEQGNTLITDGITRFSKELDQ